MELFTHAFEGTAGYNDTVVTKDDVIKIKSAALLKNWIVKLKKVKPEYTAQDFHHIMNQDTTLFNELREKSIWGDSFMIDYVVFGSGGTLRFIDYPEIITLREGEYVTIKGVTHSVTNIGALTFDAFPLPELEYSSEEEEEVEV